MTYRELYDYGVRTLTDADIAEAALDARLLLEYICHTDRNTLLAHGDSVRSDIEEQMYRMVIARRAERIPLQHITGQQDFMGLTYRVNKNALIPRQDTEILVEEAMRCLSDGMRILDLCTGSGCILLSLLHYSNECEGIGVDISADALTLARENAARLGEENALFLQSDLFDRVEGRYDMIVSNPPYIETAVIDTLEPEVRDHEPRLALDGSEDGLCFYRRIITQAPQYMTRGAGLFLEIGSTQAAAVTSLMTENGYTDVSVVKDYANLDRVVCGFFSY